MTHRERWVRTMHFQPVDHVPDEEFGYWSDTLVRWHNEGLPRHINTNEKADVFFGFAPRGGVPIDVGLHPGFESRVVEETDKYRIVIDGHGVKYMEHKDGTSSIPKYLDFPLKTRDDWKEFKRRLDPDDPARQPADWEDWKKKHENPDYPVGIGCGSLFGWLRNWMGVEHIALTLHDDPAWIHEMMDQLTLVTLKAVERALEHVKPDFAAFWEDMAFNKGPLISPRMFKEFLVPRYRQIMDLLNSRGVDVAIVDCDGNINELVPLWLEGGVNCMFPIEVAAGTDPIELRKRFGKQVLLLGGVNKRPLARGKKAIDEEIKRIAPVVESGGWIPHVDHRVPPDVSYEDYLHYLDAKRRAFGIPDPQGYDERVRATLKKA